MAEKQKKKWKKEEKKSSESGEISLEEAFPAKVVEVVGKVGVRGEANQVRCKVLTGRDEGKILRRNVRGPVRIDDILMLRETELEASALTGGRKG